MTIASGNPERAFRAPARKPARGVDSYDVLAFHDSISGIHSASHCWNFERFGHPAYTCLHLSWPQRKDQVSSQASEMDHGTCALWLVSQVVTDVVRHSAFADYARGWSNIGLTLVNFAVFFSILYQKPRRMAIYGWGLVIGGLLDFWINPTKNMKDDPWKFGYAFPVCWAVFLYCFAQEVARTLAGHSGHGHRFHQH